MIKKLSDIFSKEKLDEIKAKREELKKKWEDEIIENPLLKKDSEKSEE